MTYTFIAFLFLLNILVPIISTASSHDYSDALKKSILFFEGQRSGYLPKDQRMTWRRDSAVNDGKNLNVDLVGGYYDAGDNIKFHFPMAFTTTMLAWSAVDFGSYMSPADLRDNLVALRWGTDYLLKAVSQLPHRIFVQVGEPTPDHNCWERPEDMDTPRTAYAVNAPNPASDLAGEIAAAFAAASIAFKRFDPIYSTILLNNARNTFQYADSNRGSYTNNNPSVKVAVCPFYCSSQLQNTVALSFLVLTYAGYLSKSSQQLHCGNVMIQADSLFNLAKRQVDYILGDNPMKMSYMVGYGDQYPRQIHHRGASSPSISTHPTPIKCLEGWNIFASTNPDPNVLVGAVIGGPDVNDNFVGGRTNASETEPTTYINAPYVGLLAYFNAPINNKIA
ncbi:unnamed protein product [Cochlearia groenlandica]